MNPSPEQHDRQADQRLADFTDRLLAEQSPDLAGLASEERDLAETAARLHGAFAQSGFSPATAEKMRRRILEEHRQRMPFWQKWWTTRQARQRTITVAASALAIVVGLIAVIFLQPGDGSLPGSAGQGSDNWLPWAPIAAILLAAGLWYLTRRKE